MPTQINKINQFITPKNNVVLGNLSTTIKNKIQEVVGESDSGSSIARWRRSGSVDFGTMSLNKGYLLTSEPTNFSNYEFNFDEGVQPQNNQITKINQVFTYNGAVNYNLDNLDGNLKTKIKAVYSTSESGLSVVYWRPDSLSCFRNLVPGRTYLVESNPEYSNYSLQVPSWSPYNLSNLAAWYDSRATNTIVLNGNGVSKWKDRSGNGRDATQTIASWQPIFLQNEFNGTPGIITDGIYSVLSVPDWGLVPQPFTRVVVFKLVSLPLSNKNLMNSYGINTPSSRASNVAEIITPSGVISQHAGNSINNTGIEEDNTYIRISKYNGENSYVRTNGVQTGPANPGSNSYNGIVIGGAINQTSSSFASSAIAAVYAEVIVTNSSIPDDDCIKLEGYLAHKLGIQNNLPSDHAYRNTPP